MKVIRASNLGDSLRGCATYSSAPQRPDFVYRLTSLKCTNSSPPSRFQIGEVIEVELLDARVAVEAVEQRVQRRVVLRRAHAGHVLAALVGEQAQAVFARPARGGSRIWAVSRRKTFGSHVAR